LCLVASIATIAALNFDARTAARNIPLAVVIAASASAVYCQAIYSSLNFHDSFLTIID
jgi:hypothetical protein